jgi:hypothetical protein
MNSLFTRPQYPHIKKGKDGVLIRLFITGQMPESNNLKGERFVLAHGFRNFSPLFSGSIVLDLRQDTKS